jgi:PAS domain S-box-containing protein
LLRAITGFPIEWQVSTVLEQEVTMHKDSPQQQIDSMRQRVAALYRNASAAQQPQELLPAAFEELQTALEALQAMNEELLLQQAHVLDTREQMEAEFQAYQDLFVHAPVAYLTTKLNGTIRQANQAAATLFSNTERYLVGRSMTLFVPEGERRPFRERLSEMAYSRQTEVWTAHMQSWRGVAFRAMLTTTVDFSPLGRATLIRWIIQKMGAYASLAEPAERVRAVGDYSSG